MDPKSLANLDPKLLETYKKVMGTPTSPVISPLPNSSPSGAIQPPIQASNITAFKPAPANAPIPTPQKYAVQPEKPIRPFPSPASIGKLLTSSNQSSKLIRVLYIFASVIFFAIYIIFWLKIFKYPAPFLPF